MKYRLALLMFPLLLLGSLVAGELEIGSAIPHRDLKMVDISEKEVSLSDAMGENGLLVVFSCNTCPWVDAWEDRYTAISDQYIPKGFGMIAVNSNEAYRDRGDNLKDMQERAKKFGYQFYYTVDKGSQLATAFGATRTPHIFLFDKTGKLVYRGAIDDNAKKARKVKNAYLMNAMDEILAGNDVTITSTKALGCTIKFVEGN